MVMVWLMAVRSTASGRTSHSKAKRPRGMGEVSSRNDRPGRTAVSVIRWLPPAFVVIRPVLPAANGPSIETERTSGFHPGQVPTSDHSFQTCSALAAVSTVLPCATCLVPPRTFARRSPGVVHRNERGGPVSTYPAPARDEAAPPPLREWAGEPLQQD